MSPDTINKIFAVFASQNPTPKTELNYTNEYTLLVAVVLSAQATDVGVNKATKGLFQQVSNPKQMLDLGEEKLRQHISSIGLYNAKAKNVIKLSQTLLEKHNGQVPNNLTDLQNLAGVGRKTANVILNEWFGEPTIAVDTHIFRISRRIGLVPQTANNVDKVEQGLEKNIPPKFKRYAHHWLILHGRYICKARKPDCDNCCINQYCKKIL
jgi:endonuclease-3